MLLFSVIVKCDIANSSTPLVLIRLTIHSSSVSLYHVYNHKTKTSPLIKKAFGRAQWNDFRLVRATAPRPCLCNRGPASSLLIVWLGLWNNSITFIPASLRGAKLRQSLEKKRTRLNALAFCRVGTRYGWDLRLLVDGQADHAHISYLSKRCWLRWRRWSFYCLLMSAPVGVRPVK